MKTVLAIAGFDPSAGAGVLADIKTISAFGCYGVAVATSLTYQSTVGVFGSRNSTRDEIHSQLVPVLDDFEIAAVKTGMLPTRDVVEEVAERLIAKFKGGTVPNLVVDPVFTSTSGYKLISDDALDAIRRILIPVSRVVTPNWNEAALLSGVTITNKQTAESAAKGILSLGTQAVVITGGDAGGQYATDIFVEASGSTEVTSERIDSNNTHGTGCTFSSALASLLASGVELATAVRSAKNYVAEAIRASHKLGRGKGPLNHFHDH